MIGKGILVASGAVVATGVIVMAVFMAIMMTSMMAGGHMGMMGGQGSDPAEETPVAGITQVRVQDFAFEPANIVVDAGATVTWTNEDNIGHTVTSDEGDVLDSPLFGEGETFSYTFTVPGEYYYHCAPHPYMQGLVTVRPAGAQP